MICLYLGIFNLFYVKLHCIKSNISVHRGRKSSLAQVVDSEIFVLGLYPKRVEESHEDGFCAKELLLIKKSLVGQAKLSCW